MAEIKILHCIHPVSWGGLEIYTAELIKKLAATDVQQIVLCNEQGRVAEEMRKAGIATITYNKKKFSRLAAAKLIRKIISEKKITTLHSHTRMDMWACALALWNKRGVKHIYNLYMNAPPKQDLVHKWLFSKVDALCSSSETILSEVKKNFPIAPEKLRLIRYGRETLQFNPHPAEREQLRQQYKVQPQQLVIGTLCRIDPGKGVNELVEALNHLDDEDLNKIQLWIIGDPTIEGKDPQGQPIFAKPSLDLFNWVKEKQQDKRLKDHLVQIPFQNQYIPYIAALDIFALASYNETYSLSVLDAMMMEKPVIGTNAGGTPEQIGTNNLRGYISEPHSAESLAEAIRFYLRNQDLISYQGKYAREWSMQNHNWETSLNNFLQLYREANNL